MGRFAQLKANTGWGGVLRTAAVTFAVPFIGVGAALDGEVPWSLPAAAAVAWLAPFALRKTMVRHAAWTQRGLTVVALALLGVAFVGSALREHVDDTLLLYGVTTSMSLYISAYFWFFSDPEIERLDD